MITRPPTKHSVSHKFISFNEFLTAHQSNRRFLLLNRVHIVDLIKRAGESLLFPEDPLPVRASLFDQARSLAWFSMYFMGLGRRVAAGQPEAQSLSQQLSLRFQHKLYVHDGSGQRFGELVLNVAGRDGFEAELFGEDPAKERKDESDGLPAAVVVLFFFMTAVRRDWINRGINSTVAMVPYGGPARWLAALPHVDFVEPEPGRRQAGVRQFVLTQLLSVVDQWWEAADQIVCASYGNWHKLPIPASEASGRNAGIAITAALVPEEHELRRRAKRCFQRALVGAYLDEVFGEMVKRPPRDSNASTHGIAEHTTSGK